MINRPKYKRVLFVPDLHAPYHDKVAFKCMLAFAKWWKPEVVFVIGDVVDFYQLSKFEKDPERVLALQDDIDAGKSLLTDISDVCSDAKRIFLPGNHEFRLQKFLWTRAAELAGLKALQLPELLGLDAMNYEFIKNGRINFRGTIVKHGDIVRKFAGYTAKGELENTGLSGVSGHTHRLAVHSATNEAGCFQWMECGCLCLLTQSYMMGKTPNWQQGFGIGYYKEGSKRFMMDTVRVINGKAMYGGMEFS